MLGYQGHFHVDQLSESYEQARDNDNGISNSNSEVPLITFGLLLDLVATTHQDSHHILDYHHSTINR